MRRCLDCRACISKQHKHNELTACALIVLSPSNADDKSTSGHSAAETERRSSREVEQHQSKRWPHLTDVLQRELGGTAEKMEGVKESEPMRKSLMTQHSTGNLP